MATTRPGTPTTPPATAATWAAASLFSALMLLASGGCHKTVDYGNGAAAPKDQPAAEQAPSGEPDGPLPELGPEKLFNDPPTTADLGQTEEEPPGASEVAVEPEQPPAEPQPFPGGARDLFDDIMRGGSTEPSTPDVAASPPAAPTVDTEPLESVALEPPPEEAELPVVEQPAEGGTATSDLEWLPGAAPTDPTSVATTEKADAPSTPSPTTSAPSNAGVPIDVDNTRRLAWLLGARVSLAMLSHLDGPVERADNDWQTAAIAELLGVRPPENVAAQVAGATPARAVGFLLSETRRLAEEIGTHHGDDHAALMEVAAKSNALVAIYARNPALAQPMSKAIASAAERADLPTEVWRPLTELLAGQPTEAQVRSEVFRIHEAAEQTLRRSPVGGE